KYVYMAIRKNEQGFTLISMLITITILFTTLPFLVYLIQSVSISSNYQEISVHHFFHFLRDEFIGAKEYKIENNTIILEYPSETVSIEKFGSLIRRQVDGRGHEIFLRDVDTITFTSLLFGVKTEIKTLQGEQYEKTIIFY